MALRWIVVHHSATPRSTPFHTIREAHLVKGWHDVGYHYVITEDGRIWYGRQLPNVGAHAMGHNFESVGICVVGDNTRPDQRWDALQIASLKDLLNAWALIAPHAKVVGHGTLEGAHTACPGLPISVTQFLEEH